MVAARKWVEFVNRLAPIVTHDLDALAEDIRDGWADLRAKRPADHERLRRARLRRAEKRLAEAREKQAEVRAALHLDDEDD